MGPAGSSPSEKETWNIVQHVAVPQVTEMIVADFCLRHWVVRAEALGVVPNGRKCHIRGLEGPSLHPNSTLALCLNYASVFSTVEWAR